MNILHWISQIIPVVCERVQQVICLEYSWKIVDLDDVTKFVQIDVEAHVDKEVVVNVLNANSRGLFQVRLNLAGQTQQPYLILRIKALLSKRVSSATSKFTSSVKSVQETLEGSVSFSSLPKVILAKDNRGGSRTSPGPSAGLSSRYLWTQSAALRCSCVAVDDDFVVSGMTDSDDLQVQQPAAGLVKVLSSGGCCCAFCNDSLSRTARGM